jgi:TonB-dependent receptor
VGFSQLQNAGFSNSRFLKWLSASPGYASLFTTGIDPGAARNYFDALPAANRVADPEGDAQDYDANESVVAGYVMAELFLSEKLTLLPGVRYERTSVDYTGYDVLFDDEGDYVSTQPLTGNDTYGFLLPALHVKYALDTSTNLRAAYTRTLARPNYYDLVPYQLVFTEDAEISRGNSNLVATTSSNLDLMAERYFQSVGVLSAGVFYKNLGDYIYPFRFRETVRGDVFDVTQPQNGESASLWGLEFALQNQLRFLPAPLNGLGIYANYTWTDSSAKFPGRGGDATLPGQSAHVGNFAVSFEQRGFSARASWNIHGRYIDAVGQTAAEDVYYDNRTQLDVNVSQRLTKNLRLYVDVLNLTNAPLRYYYGSPNRPIQEEYYRSWAFFGLRANF